MKTLATALHRTVLLAALPAALALASCGNDDPDPTPVTPDQGKVMLVHASPSASASVKVVANDSKEVGQIAYGTNSGYLNVLTGAQSLKVNDAASGSTVATQALTVEKDKSYSLFTYSPTTNLGSIATLATTDDLTAPSAGKAKIRFVHLGVGAPTPLTLTVPGPVSGTIDIVSNVGFGTASTYTEFTPAAYNLSLSTGTGATSTPKVAVGDGTGTGTGTKTYVAGKIYTVLLRGIDNNAVDVPLRLKAVVIENN